MIWALIFVGVMCTFLCWLVIHWGHELQTEMDTLRKQLLAYQGDAIVAGKQIISVREKTEARFKLLETQVDITRKDCTELISGWGTNFDIIKKEQEVLQIRQRTLEKKIIGGERTINLNIIDPKGKAKPLLDRAGVKTSQ